jgi:hypothetical protein
VHPSRYWPAGHDASQANDAKYKTVNNRKTDRQRDASQPKVNEHQTAKFQKEHKTRPRQTNGKQTKTKYTNSNTCAQVTTHKKDNINTATKTHKDKSVCKRFLNAKKKQNKRRTT